MPISVLANDRLRLSITDTCNFRCPYCSNEGQLHNKKKLLSIEFIKRLADKLLKEDIYVRKMNLTGGEPVVHPQLVEIVKICSCFADSIILNTNGELLNEDKILRLHEAGLTYIKFGIDSFFQNTSKPALVRHTSHTNKIIENLLFAKKIMPRTSANIVLTDFNAHEIGNLLKFILDNEINKVEFLELIDYDFRGLSNMSEPGPMFRAILDEYGHLFKEITYNSRLGKYICKCENSLIVQFAEDFCIRRVCQNLWTRVDSLGRLTPCIKAQTGSRIDFEESLAKQVARCNNLMCYGQIGHIPRDYSGRLLPTLEKGHYIKPNWQEIHYVVRETTMDP